MVAYPQVSHCYLRQVLRFSYQLFTMIRSQCGGTTGCGECYNKSTGIDNYRSCIVSGYKKKSMRYELEDWLKAWDEGKVDDAGSSKQLFRRRA